MYRKLLLMAATVLLAGAAPAKTLELVEGGYEAVLGDVSFPGSSAGLVVFKMCPTCESRALPADARTVYVGADGRQKPLAEFLDEVAALRATAGGDRTTAVGIFYDLEARRVTRVRLHADVLDRP
jgi:hypothetical protein